MRKALASIAVAVVAGTTLVGATASAAPSSTAPEKVAQSTTGHDGFRPFRNVEGHTDCEIRVGATSTVRCADGFRTRS